MEVGSRIIHNGRSLETNHVFINKIYHLPKMACCSTIKGMKSVTGRNLKNVMLRKKCQSQNTTDYTNRQNHTKLSRAMTKSTGFLLEQ